VFAHQPWQHSPVRVKCARSAAAKDNNSVPCASGECRSLEKHLLDKYGGPVPDAMVELDHIKLLQDNDFHTNSS
jgi:protocatechuate 3,4-dioxygenase beta subunit